MRLSQLVTRSASLLLRSNHRLVSHEAASPKVFPRQEVDLLADLISVNLTRLNCRPDEWNQVLAEHIGQLRTKVLSENNYQCETHRHSSDTYIASLLTTLTNCSDVIDVDSLLDMCFSWYEIRAPALVQRGFQIITNRDFDQLTTDQFSKIMLLISLQRQKMSPQLSGRIERYFKDHMSEMSLEQIALYCYAFFRTQTQPSDDEAISYIIEKTFIQSTGHEIVKNSMLKFLRFIRIRKSVSQLRSLYEKLDARSLNISKNPYLLVNLMKLGEYYYVYNPSIYEIMFQSLPEMTCRIKDLAETLRCCLGMAHLPSGRTYEYFATKRFDVEDLAKHSFVIAYASYLAYLGVIRDDLISRIFPYSSRRKLRSFPLSSRH